MLGLPASNTVAPRSAYAVSFAISAGLLPFMVMTGGSVSATFVFEFTLGVVVLSVWLLELGAWVLQLPSCLSHSPFVILTQYVSPVAESFISKPLETDAVPISARVNTATVAVILETTHSPALASNSFTLFATSVTKEFVTTGEKEASRASISARVDVATAKARKISVSRLSNS